MKNKKNMAGRLGIIAVALTLVTTCLMGGTLAKYTSEVSGTANATVAKWSLKAGSEDTNYKVWDKVAIGETANGRATNTAVKDGVIAPGTSGTLPVYYNLFGSEVAANVKVEIMVSTADLAKLPDNFKFNTNIKGTPATITKADLTGDTYKEVFSKDIKLEQIQTEASAKGNADIKWEWGYETGTTAQEKAAGNTKDTADASTATDVKDIVINIKVTGTQLETNPS